MLEIIDSEKFEHVKRTITRLIGFDCSQYSNSFLARRTEVRIRANNMDSYSEYSRLLQKSKEERDKLNKELTINVTNFFRDAVMWDVFKDEVIPTMIKLKKEKALNKIRIWCVGCSSGEEPLSIAICFLEALGHTLKRFDVSISGIDMDPMMIENARRGLYEEHQFREMNERYRNKYFDKAEDGSYKAKKEIMDMVSCKVGDVFSAFKPKNLDIIFCRNTVIYFSKDAKSKLYEDFYDCLSDEGFFIMGKTEILQGPAREKFQVFDGKERIYIKE